MSITFYIDTSTSSRTWASPNIYNQDLAGFFTSIDQQRFLGAWHMLLDFLRPHMDVSDNEVFSVYPGRFNNPGDLIRGRTCRRLGVTRKIVIKDIPALLSPALDMQTFRLGHRWVHRCVRQLRGNPMGSSLSPALCLMIVSISEQTWSINFKISPTTTSSRQLQISHSPTHRPIETIDSCRFPIAVRIGLCKPLTVAGFL